MIELVFAAFIHGKLMAVTIHPRQSFSPPSCEAMMRAFLARGAKPGVTIRASRRVKHTRAA